MLTGFEDITEDLTEYELKLVPLFVKGFIKRVGKEQAITNRQICEQMKGKYKVSDARVRKIINHIRIKRLVRGLVATSIGYYVTGEANDVVKYLSSLRGRRNEIDRLIDEFEDYLHEL